MKRKQIWQYYLCEIQFLNIKITFTLKLIGISNQQIIYHPKYFNNNLLAASSFAIYKLSNMQYCIDKERSQDTIFNKEQSAGHEVVLRWKFTRIAIQKQGVDSEFVWIEKYQEWILSVRFMLILFVWQINITRKCNYYFLLIIKSDQKKLAVLDTLLGSTMMIWPFHFRCNSQCFVIQLFRR